MAMVYLDFLLVTFGTYCLAFLATLCLLYCIGREKKLRRSVHDKLTILELIFTLFWISSVAPINLLTYLNGGLEGDFGYYLCQANGSFIVSAAGIVMLAQMLMALDRFFVIVLGKVLRPGTLVLISIVSTSFNIFVISIQMTQKGGFVRQEGGLWCFFPMTFESDKSIESIWPSVAMISYFSLFTIIQNSVYFMVLIRARNVFAETNRLHSPRTNESCTNNDLAQTKKDEPGRIISIHKSDVQDVPNPNAKLQKAILKRCLAIMTVFQLTYGPAFLLLLYRLITNRPINPLLEVCVTALSVTDTLIAPLLYFYMRSDYYRAFQEYILGVKISKQSSNFHSGSRSRSHKSSDML